MNPLEAEGLQSYIRRAKAFARGLAADIISAITTHVTQEVEKIMSELEDLRTAVDQELADDAAQNQLLAEREQTIAELELALSQAQEAAAGAAAGEAEAKAALDEALAAAVDATTKLRSNDPVVEPEPDPLP